MQLSSFSLRTQNNSSFLPHPQTLPLLASIPHPVPTPITTCIYTPSTRPRPTAGNSSQQYHLYRCVCPGRQINSILLIYAATANISYVLHTRAAGSDVAHVAPVAPRRPRLVAPRGRGAFTDHQHAQKSNESHEYIAIFIPFSSGSGKPVDNGNLPTLNTPTLNLGSGYMEVSLKDVLYVSCQFYWADILLGTHLSNYSIDVRRLAIIQICYL